MDYEAFKVWKLAQRCQSSHYLNHEIFLAIKIKDSFRMLLPMINVDDLGLLEKPRYNILAHSDKP